MLRLPVHQLHSGLLQIRNSPTVAGAASAWLRDNRERTDFPFHSDRQTPVGEPEVTLWTLSPAVGTVKEGRARSGSRDMNT
jgi:hypothetical protein